MSSEEYPLFETGTPAAQYQQIINFSINYLEGLLVELAHMELPAEFETNLRQYAELQQKLVSRERTVRHGFQYQIEKLFTEFRTFRRSRLSANRSSDWFSLGLAGHNSSRVLSAIESVSAKLDDRFDQRILHLNRRLKFLVHRSDDNQTDNPLSPDNLCHAFLSSVDALRLTSLQTCRMVDLFEYVLQQQLDSFYKQLDLGLYHLDVLPELTDSSLFLVPEQQQEAAPGSQIGLDDEDSTLTRAESQQDSGHSLVVADMATQTLIADVVSLRDEVAPAPDPGISEPATTVEDNPDSADECIDSPEGTLDEVQEALETDLPLATDGGETRSDVAESPPGEVTSSEHQQPVYDQTVPDLAGMLASSTRVEAFPTNMSLDDVLEKFRQQSQAGFDDAAKRFLAWHRRVNSLLSPEQTAATRKFTHYYANLLSSPRLSEALSWQMSRLSGVLFELIVSDSAFFTDDSNVVQNLINSIVDFEIRCGHAGESMASLTSIIDQLVELDPVDSAAFDPWAGQYESMKKNEIEFILQQRKDKKKLETQLKDEVLELIKSVTAQLSLEADTHAFFYDDWQLLLLQLGKKIGRHSPAFEQAADITRMLGAALSEHSDKDLSRKYQGIAFPALLKAVDKGLESLGYGSEHRNRVRKQLIGEFRKRNIRHSGHEEEASPIQPGAETLELFSSTIRSHSSKLSDIHTPARVAPNPLNNANTVLACELDIGSWVEMQTGNGKTFKRAKLKWKSKTRDEFVFVDQRGHKIRKLTEDELDRELADGKIKPLKLGNSSERKKKPAARLGSGFHF